MGDSKVITPRQKKHITTLCTQFSLDSKKIEALCTKYGTKFILQIFELATRPKETKGSSSNHLIFPPCIEEKIPKEVVRPSQTSISTTEHEIVIITTTHKLGSLDKALEKLPTETVQYMQDLRSAGITLREFNWNTINHFGDSITNRKCIIEYLN